VSGKENEAHGMHEGELGEFSGVKASGSESGKGAQVN
jgi:hypothetical protein